jgi:hypothetical protein
MRTRSLRGRFFGLCILAGALATAGCHNYVPISDAQPGTKVRVRVPVTSALDGDNGGGQSASIEGDVVEFGDTLVLAVLSRQEYGAYREVVLYDTLKLAPEQRLTVERAEFSTGRTVLLGAVIAVGATALAISAFNAGTGDDKPIDPGPPPPSPAVVVSNSVVSGLLGLLGLSR